MAGDGWWANAMRTGSFSAGYLYSQEKFRDGWDFQTTYAQRPGIISRLFGIGIKTKSNIRIHEVNPERRWSARERADEYNEMRRQMNQHQRYADPKTYDNQQQQQRGGWLW